MCAYSRNWRLAVLRFLRLEDRTVPAALNALVSRADPSLFTDTAGGTSAGNPRSISVDGRYVVFASSAGNVVAGQVDANGGNDVFVYDRQSNATELISHAYSSSVTAANAVSFNPTISGDGRYVAFESCSTNMVPGMTSPYSVLATPNVFLYDRLTLNCTLISHQYSSPLLGDTSGGSRVEISANGQVVVFSSVSVNLILNSVTPGYPYHAYAYSAATGQLKMMDHAYGNAAAPGNAGTYSYGVSADGHYAVISSSATNLTGITVNSGEVFRYDTLTGANMLVSVSAVSGPSGGDNGGYRPVISDDGSCISFNSVSTNLVAGYTGSAVQIYRWDGMTGQVTLVTHTPASDSAGCNAETDSPVISGDGRYVAYPSLATDLERLTE
jgi:hypothetical protein